MGRAIKCRDFFKFPSFKSNLCENKTFAQSSLASGKISLSRVNINIDLTIRRYTSIPLPSNSTLNQGANGKIYNLEIRKYLINRLRECVNNVTNTFRCDWPRRGAIFVYRGQSYRG